MQLKMPKSALPNEESKENTSFSASFKEGVQTIRNVPGLIGVMIMATFTNFLFQPINTLTPNFIKYVHSGSEYDLALFLALFQGGILVGAIIASIGHGIKGLSITNSSEELRANKDFRQN